MAGPLFWLGAAAAIALLAGVLRRREPARDERARCSVCGRPLRTVVELKHGYVVLVGCDPPDAHFFLSEAHMRYGDAQLRLSQAAAERLQLLSPEDRERAIDGLSLFSAPPATARDFERAIRDFSSYRSPNDGC